MKTDEINNKKQIQLTRKINKLKKYINIMKTFMKIFTLLLAPVWPVAALFAAFNLFYFFLIFSQITKKKNLEELQLLCWSPEGLNKRSFN